MNKKPDDKIIRFILQSKYLLKQSGVNKSKWRKLIAFEFTPGNPGKSDEFCMAWEYLQAAGLIQ